MTLCICTGGEIRTPIKSFGDFYSTLELRPFSVNSGSGLEQ